MILGIGVDIVSNCRFDSKPEGFLEKIFTPGELASSLSAPNKSEFFASRFAAKEAFAKALGSGFRGIQPVDIEVCSDELGKPYIKLLKGDCSGCVFHLSLSHERESSVAMVVIEDGKK